MTEEAENSKFVIIGSTGAKPDEVSISKAGLQQVIWKSDIGDVTVEFKNGVTPFGSAVFSVPASGAAPSGPAVVNPSDTGYKYDIKQGVEVLFDPKVFIDK
jgi:hypothetical protein